MSALDSFTPVEAIGVGVLLSALNPKNLLLAIAAAVAIAQIDISTGQEIVVYVLFVAIASLGVAAPVVLYFALGERSRELLDGLKNWMVQHNAAIMTVLLLFLGVKLIGDAISGFPAG